MNSSSITSRERVIKTLNHEEPDKVPIDFGGTDVTSIQLGPYKEVASYLGCEIKEPIYLHDLFQQQTEVSMEIADKMHSDTRFIYLGYPKHFRKDLAYDGTPVDVPEKFTPIRQENGDLLVMDSDGDLLAKMPKDGFFFDYPNHKLAGCKTIADMEVHRTFIETFNIPFWYDATYEEMGHKARILRKNTDKFIIGVFDGHTFQAAQILRGWSQFPLDLMMNPGLVDGLLEILVDGHIKNFNQWYQYVSPWVDAIEMTDDMGTQAGLWISPDMYRKQIKKHHTRLYQHIRKTAPDLKLILHSCGSVYDLIPDFIEMGIQILNPIQYTAKNMELERLKNEFGKDISFWGGGCDSQGVLYSGTPQQVSDEVKKNLDIMSPGGGYVFASIHNTTEGVPLENIMAMYEAAHKFGAY